MAETKKGRQTPTTSVIEPYDKTYGAEAVALYNLTSRTAQEWQELLLYDILAYNDDGLWKHTKFGYAVPRRNGKNEIIAMRELWGLFNGEHIMHTAHRTTTSHSAWERLCFLLKETGLTEGEDYKTLKQYGLEEIEVFGAGRINFRTRSSKGGLGEGFDLMVIDEAQEYTDDQAAALKYVVSSSKNPQTIYCGTPPTTLSSGAIFPKLRKNILQGDAQNAGWAEWSVEFQKPIRDIDAWYETNPSLGVIISERSIYDEIDLGDDIDFNIQRLGLWLQYNQQSAISKVEWRELELDKMPKCQPRLFAGVKFDKDGSNANLSVALKTQDDKIFIECIDTQPIREGNAWIVNWILSLNPDAIVIDGLNGQEKLIQDLKDNKCKTKIIIPTTKEYCTANSNFEDAIHTKTLCHMGQPSLEAVVSNCEHRAIGTGGGFGYRPLKEGYEIGLLDSAVLAYWACSEAKEKRKQRIET